MTHPPSVSELQRLWQQFKQGDQLAFAQLYQLYAAELGRYGTRLVADKELVRDAVQDLFVHLWQSRQNLGQVHSVRAYLYASLRREVFKQCKEPFVSTTHLDEWEMDISLSAESVLIASQQWSETRHKLQQQVDSLPLRQREAIFLRFYSELEFSEMAAIMGISVRAVYKLLYKALDNLRKSFSFPLALPLGLLLLLLLY